jgi:hypothetical protein
MSAILRYFSVAQMPNLIVDWRMNESYAGLPRRRRIVAIIAISGGAAMLQIDALIPSVTLPTIARALHVEP